MSPAAWRCVWRWPASLSDLWRLTRMAGTSSSRCPSASGWWPRPAARKDQIFTMPETARFYYSVASRVRQLGAAKQRPPYLSDPGRIPQISGASSGPPSAQAMTEAAAWRRPTSPTFSSSRGQASAPGIIDRMPTPSNPRYLLQFFGTSPRSLSESAGWRRRQTAWKGQIYALREPATSLLSRLGQARQFTTSNQPQRQTTKPHLYLVLDDHENRFAIHKLDIDSDLDVDCGSADTPVCLPEPPSIRIESPTDRKFAQFAALGSHIIAVCPSTDGVPLIEDGGSGATVIFDTKTSMFWLSNMLPRNLVFGYEAAIAVRNRLYVFESYTDINFAINDLFFCGGLHCLAAHPSDDEMLWPWQRLFYSSQFSWSWTKYPPEFPFDPKSITAYVVHPRTGTILLSAFGCGWGTFSYGTRGSSQWKRRGDWVLPFKGPAHYDKVLRAWVGLHLGSLQKVETDGYLCACRDISGRQPPKWEVGREKLLLEHPHWRHVDVKLVYMGERSKYCLMERLAPEGGDKMNYVIRLTMFIVMYGEDGQLRTMAHRPARFYKAPSYCNKFDVQAFCM